METQTRKGRKKDWQSPCCWSALEKSCLRLVVQPQAVTPRQTRSMAIASLFCGLFLFAFPLSILAIIFGHLSVSEIRKSAGRLKGEGIAITGLVLGYVGLAIIPVILICAAIALPNV